MEIIRCYIVSRPANDQTMSVRTSGSTDAFIRGSGEITYTCGNCGHILIQNVYRGQISGTIIKCPICGNYNKVP